MRVTMNIFSGRPNPTWMLTPPQARELIERVAAAVTSTAADEPPVLGFRGFTVDADLEDMAVHPVCPRTSSFRLSLSRHRRPRLPGRNVRTARPRPRGRPRSIAWQRWMYRNGCFPRRPGPSTTTSSKQRMPLCAGRPRPRLQRSSRKLRAPHGTSRCRRGARSSPGSRRVRAVPDAHRRHVLGQSYSSLPEQLLQLRHQLRIEYNGAARTALGPSVHRFRMRSVVTAAASDGYLSACSEPFASLR